jgi:serine/threonine-protein kinase
MFPAMTALELHDPSPSQGDARSAGLSARYRSLFVIGRGGMGSVEAALAIEPPGSEPDAADGKRAYERIVALKRLLPDAARDKRRVDMFLREARLAAMLEHPNVVTAYDYGEIDGELYLAMEYVEGQPLSRVLRAIAEAGETMSPSVAAYVLAEVCKGLHAAHELRDPSTKQPLQLVHRDVSPQNVMIGYDGRVRLLDFGVAKIEAESVTKTGEVKGKTAYMSPEQAMGEPLDRRSDLFGVGALLFECIALRRMWGDGTDMEVIRKLALEAPPRLEECGVELPDGMSDLHARLVARSAKDRPATAREVAEALLAFAGDADGAASALRSIMERHFAEQAREQRERLDAALKEVAPEQADELRESVLPSDRDAPPRRASVASAGRATADAPAAARSRAWLAALGLAVLGVVAWRTIANAPAAPPAATAAPAESTAAPASAAPSAPGPEEAASTAPPTVPPTTSASAATPAPTTRVSAKPAVRPAPSASAPRIVAAPASASAPSRASAEPTKPKPLDIDDHPF